jgi:adenine-specific DNA methylase
MDRIGQAQQFQIPRFGLQVIEDRLAVAFRRRLFAEAPGNRARDFPTGGIQDRFVVLNLWPELFRRLAVPKTEELVATAYRHGGRDEAEAFFMKGMSEALTAMRKSAAHNEPLAIYYAFKQSEAGYDGVTSAGWASSLQAVVDTSAGFQ